jgi:hypothetical protein
MAKKKGKREDIFTFPEFDKDEYRAKEARDSKVIIFAVFHGLMIALLCHFVVLTTGLGSVAMFLGFISPFGLISILPFITDTSEFERKNWFGPMMMSFMSWLGLFILLSNPPFNDIAKPKFQQTEIYTEVNEEWNTTVTVGPDTELIIVVSVKDNSGVETVQISGSKSGSGFMSNKLMIKIEEGNSFGILGSNLYYYHFPDGLDADSYSFIFKAEDSAGNSNTKSMTFSVS